MAAVAGAALGLTGLSPGALAAPPQDWPQFRGGPTHQGSDQPATISAANVSKLDLAWFAALGSVVSSPAVVGGVVYVGADTGLYAFPASCSRTPSCEPRWRAPAAGAIGTSPAVAGGMVYVAAVDHNLHAFDAAGVQGCSGVPKACAPLWSADTGGADPSSPVVAGGRVYIGSDDDTL